MAADFRLPQLLGRDVLAALAWFDGQRALPQRRIPSRPVTLARTCPEMSPSMSGKFDWAALLIAVLTVAISPLTTIGPWDKMNTIVASVVGIIIVAFTWPREENFRDDESSKIPLEDNWIKAALAIAYGLIIAIGSAWIVQLILNPPDCPEHPPDDKPFPQVCVKADDIAGQATNWALGIGLVAAIILFFCLRMRIKKLSRGVAK